MTENIISTKMVAAIIILLATILIISAFAVTLKKNVEQQSNEVMSELQKVKKIETHNLQEANEYMKKILSNKANK